MALLAHLGPLQEDGRDRRTAIRRKLWLGSTLDESGAQVLIHDLSSTGLLIETSADLTGTTLEVDIPEAGTSQATIVWRSGRFFGCQFKHPIPLAAVSAALLRSPGPEQLLGVESEEEFASSAWQDPAAEFRLPKTGLWWIAALVVGALTYFILTGDVMTTLVVAAILGLLFSLLITWGVWAENNVDF